MVPAVFTVELFESGWFPGCELAVRRGDIYGLMVEHFAQQKNYQGAYGLLEEMRSKIPNLNLAYYVNIPTLEAISKAIGVPIVRSARGGNEQEDGGGSGDSEIEEEDEKDSERKTMPTGLYSSHSGFPMNGRIF